MKILMTGATGFIGLQVGHELSRRGHEVSVVSRDAEQARSRLPFVADVIEGDLVRTPVRSPRLAAIQAVVHLMGESIAEGRWNAAKKKRILESRTLGTRHLRESLTQAGCQDLRVFLSASAIGFYGDRGEEELTESSGAGDSFLADVVTQWENEIFTLRDDFPTTRVAALRFGLVLGPNGGALARMSPPFRLGLGGCLGSGQQWMSWIHLRDLLELIAIGLTDERVRDVLNAVSPHPVRNAEFTRKLAAAFGKGTGPAAPRWALRALLGAVADELTASQKVRPQRLLELGFPFRSPAIDDVFRELK